MEQFLTQPMYSIAAFFVLALLVLAVLVIDARVKWSRMFGGKTKIRQDVALQALSRIALAEDRLKNLESRTDILDRVSRLSIHKVAFLRYNPFQDTGGDQSFSLCFLDKANNGVVISSLYARDGVRVYGKSIEGGKPKQQLSEEEEKVLGEAIKKISNS